MRIAVGDFYYPVRSKGKVMLNYRRAVAFCHKEAFNHVYGFERDLENYKVNPDTNGMFYLDKMVRFDGYTGRILNWLFAKSIISPRLFGYWLDGEY